MPFSIHKVVAALPGTLEPNAIYLVRVGDGFDLYVSDTTGSIAHKVNSDMTGAAVHVGTEPPADTSMIWIDTNQ